MNSWDIAVMALVAGGLVGGFVLARYARGLRALLWWALWLPVPVVVLAVALGSHHNPMTSPAQANYNFWFGLVLLSLLGAVPWLGANLIGAIVGWLIRRRSAD